MSNIEYPTPHDYPHISPFRFWCQKVMPLVYDDSLSYYELLCKVVEQLNKTAEDLNYMGEDITTLYKFVNDYFKNLDVQTEINNKIDSMAGDGSLTTILRDIVNTGSPIFVNSTGKMTDRTAVYILTTNGHVYYYSGDSFVDSGVNYGSPENVIYCSRSSGVTKLTDIRTAGYYALNNETLSTVTDLDGVVEGTKSGMMLVVTPAFETQTTIYQELYIVKGGKLYTYYRYFQPDLLPVKWNDITFDTSGILFNETLDESYEFLYNLNKPGYFRISANQFTLLGDLDNIIEGTKSGLLLNIPRAFESTSFMYQELTVIKGDVYYKYRRYVQYGTGTGKEWVDITDSDAKTDEIKYIAFGDSRTSGITSTKKENYPEIIARKKGYNVVNYGVSGSTMCKVDDDHDDFMTIINRHSDLKADVISIMYGRNDYALNANLGEVTDQSLSTVMGSLYQGVKKILMHNSTCNIVIISPFNDFNYGTEPNYAKTKANSKGWNLNDLNDKLKEFCKLYSFKYVDGTNGFCNSIIRTNIPDGTHLTNDEGIASFICSELY